MKRIKSKFFGVDIEDLNMNIDDKKVYKNWRKVDKEHSKIIMFPSSHDIFEEYLDDFIITCKNILNAGHKLLIVTKPRRKCIEKMIVEFDEFKKDILFRLTITSDDEKIVKYYEPNASSIEERINCLKLLFENNYRTSVSMEPFLSDPMKLIELVDKYISDDIWIGTMSGIKSNNEIDDKHKDELYKLYSKENLIDIINKLRNNKKIFWKTSIMKIVIRK
jgi:DNA repair photolyase